LFCFFFFFHFSIKQFQFFIYVYFILHQSLFITIQIKIPQYNYLPNTPWSRLTTPFSPLLLFSLLLRKYQLQNIITFFSFYIISTIFYYYSNKKIYYNTIFFFYFFIQIIYTLYHINHFLLPLKTIKIKNKKSLQL
jgi:hypothetical protein